MGGSQICFLKIHDSFGALGGQCLCRWVGRWDNTEGGCDTGEGRIPGPSDKKTKEVLSLFEGRTSILTS